MKKFLFLLCLAVFSCKTESIDQGGMLITGSKSYSEVADIIMKASIGVNSNELYFERFVNSLRKTPYDCQNEVLLQVSEVVTSPELQKLLEEKRNLIAESQPLGLSSEYVVITEYAKQDYTKEQIRDLWLKDCNISKKIKQSHLKGMAFFNYERNWVLILK